MIRFAIKFVKDTPTVFEIECVEAFCFPWEVKPGETKYEILAPPQFKNEVWYSHAIYCSMNDARTALVNDIRYTMHRDAEKSKTIFSESEFFKKIASIKVVSLEKENAEKAK